MSRRERPHRHPHSHARVHHHSTAETWRRSHARPHHKRRWHKTWRRPHARPQHESGMKWHSPHHHHHAATRSAAKIILFCFSSAIFFFLFCFGFCIVCGGFLCFFNGFPLPIYFTLDAFLFYPFFTTFFSYLIQSCYKESNVRTGWMYMFPV